MLPVRLFAIKLVPSIEESFVAFYICYQRFDEIESFSHSIKNNSIKFETFNVPEVQIFTQDCYYDTHGRMKKTPSEIRTLSITDIDNYYERTLCIPDFNQQLIVKVYLRGCIKSRHEDILYIPVEFMNTFVTYVKEAVSCRYNTVNAPIVQQPDMIVF